MRRRELFKSLLGLPLLGLLKPKETVAKLIPGTLAKFQELKVAYYPYSGETNLPICSLDSACSEWPKDTIPLHEMLEICDSYVPYGELMSDYSFIYKDGLLSKIVNKFASVVVDTSQDTDFDVYEYLESFYG